MIRGFHTAASSLVTQQTHLDIVANNIANANTTGFKPQQAEFAALLYANVEGGASNTISVGHGVRVQGTGTNFGQGDLRRTDMPLDFAILGEGFFAVESEADSSITYTRDGSFRALTDRGKTYLTDAAGNYVLDASEKKIELGENFDRGKIGVFKFDNPYGLSLTGGNKFAATEASGEADKIDKPDIKAGYLEGSAVKLAEEMVKMIEASKGFSFGSKVLQTADEMEKTMNQLR